MLGCKPPHWSLPIHLRNCDTKEKMSQAVQAELVPPIPSCQAIERYGLSYTEAPMLSMFKDCSASCVNISSMIHEEKKILSEILIQFSGKIDFFTSHTIF